MNKMKETLEEAAEKHIEKNSLYFDTPYEKNHSRVAFIEGAKWQAEKMYSEEEVYKLLLKHQSSYRSTVRNTSPLDWSFDIKQWFEQFKKK